MTPQDKETIERAAYLLRVVGQFIDTNPVSDYTVIYDEAECDGACLRDDCSVAADELDHYRRLLAEAEAREAGEREEVSDEKLVAAMRFIHEKYGPRLDLFVADVDRVQKRKESGRARSREWRNRRRGA